MKMQNRKIVVVLILMSMILLVSAVEDVEEDHEAIFKQAQEIINSKISCDELSYDQLEILGDYYMEQIHPGEAHERMDAMMGGEGSESLRQVHINMGINFYCRNSLDYYRGNTGMMGGGMMSNNMMNSITGRAYYYDNQNKPSLLNYIPLTLITILLILVIVFLIKNINSKRSYKK